MNRVLFDTNIISYWHAGDQRFKPPLHRLLGELRRDKTAFYLSAITIQELGFRNTAEPVGEAHEDARPHQPARGRRKLSMLV